MRDLPPDLTTRPFTRHEARALGVSDRVLQGHRFVRVFPRVWRHRVLEMSPALWRDAARLSMPPQAQLTGISRIQHLGLDFGPLLPVRFVVEGDLHLVPPEIFLHRTKRLPPCDEDGVTPTAAFVAYCRRARVVDAIKVGDWLLHHGHTTVHQIESLALAELWRDGAPEALWVLEHLDDRARSLMESETRAVLAFAGLPRPEVNVAVTVEPGIEVIGDLLYRAFSTVVEYDGKHHQLERSTYTSDVDRYALYRRAGIRYVQVTHEKLAHARSLVGEVYRELLAAGYDGPAPELGERWRTLFVPICALLAPDRRWEVNRRSGTNG